MALNGWGIYGLNGWGSYGLIGWGIYGSDGWGSYGKVSYCFLGDTLKNTGLQGSTLSGQHMTMDFGPFESIYTLFGLAVQFLCAQTGKGKVGILKSLY